MLELTFLLALTLPLTVGFPYLVFVTFPLLLFPIWLPAKYLATIIVFGDRQVDPGRVLGSAISLLLATVLLTMRPPFLAMILIPPFYAVALLPWVFSGKERVSAREVRLNALTGLGVPVLWCVPYYRLGGEFVLMHVS